jgi:ATP-dependent protease ClpP protease subunit
VIHNELFNGQWLEEWIRHLGDSRRVFIGLNSPGGSTDAALKLFDAMAGREVEVEIVGRACSAAVTLAMAGKRRRMERNATLMIHTPIDCVMGTPRDLRFQADNLERVTKRCVSIYSEATRQPRSVVRRWFDGNDFYFDSSIALKMGLVTELFDHQEPTEPQ